ncbi:CHAT domain-containing protein [Komarekiella sp. 'clone 1']|uniref:CHAT domain-containing protein n=1 Tax=Komarekiella delphini-convector SJRDD-AB1 TaxID=2593771 RepID=A0AA41BA26_9NOST|nr:CHAT domain-containing protein [Komarekiella delphini-convector]MBD6620964.1 CHAT domain-containing protein [Komarekiella delphini-convector SJRDD-AB1]
MIKRRDWFKYVFSSILGLLTVVGKPSVIAAQGVNKEVQKRNQARLLTQIGEKYLNEGRASEALESWESATKIYRQLGYEEGITGSLINQNLALQALGLNHQACNTLLQALKLNTDTKICAISPVQSTESITKLLIAAIDKQKHLPVNLFAWHNFGDVLRLIGKLDESKIILAKTLSIAQQIPSVEPNNILLSLANTEEAIYQQARNKYYEVEELDFKNEIVDLIPQQALKSLEVYQQVNQVSANSPVTQLKSQLHHLSLLLDFEKWLTVELDLGNQQLVEIRNQIQQQIQPSVNRVLKNSSTFSQLSATQSVYAKLNFANSLSQIPEQQLRSLAIEYGQSALQTARNTTNQRIKSYSLGTLGKLQPEKSEAYFREALSLAQSIQAEDIVYQWQQQLGNLYNKQGKAKEALTMYKSAIDNLAQIRDSILSSNIDIQFFFQEEVEPVYRDYMKLLLKDSNPNLKEVIQTNERLQTAQLENFLKCGKLDLVALNEVQNLNSAGIIHIIDLDDTIEVILQSQDRSFHHHSVEANLIKDHVSDLIRKLQKDKLVSTNVRQIILPSQALYEKLIAPISSYLPASGTLIFILDKSFQSIPMGILYDGKDYLIEHYSVAVTLGSKIRSPKPLSKKRFTALIAALSKPSPSLSDSNAPKGIRPLPQAKEEVKDVQSQTQSYLTLLDEKFTTRRLEQEISKNNFPIVHISTHGQFSSDPLKTVLLAYEKVINIREFDKLLKSRIQTDADAIDLLVLSACQTAKGNKRSALGMAGVAAQAGARTTVATLWLVDADSTALLMEEFYKELKNGISKAEALRLAQLTLMKNPKYAHHYYWAPFLLVGSWL